MTTKSFTYKVDLNLEEYDLLKSKIKLSYEMSAPADFNVAVTREDEIKERKEYTFASSNEETIEKIRRHWEY